MNELLKALSLASIAHQSQTRKGDGGAPYVNHLIEVAFLLSEVAKVDDVSILQAAVLHDILEDTDTTKDELLKTFKNEIIEYVEAVTDDKTLSLSERRQKQIEHMATASNGIKLIKLADHCSNVASIPPNWNRDRINGYLEWSFQVASRCFDASIELAELYNDRYSESKRKLLGVE